MTFSVAHERIGSFYHHFGSKEKVAATLYMDALSDVCVRLVLPHGLEPPSLPWLQEVTWARGEAFALAAQEEGRSGAVFRVADGLPGVGSSRRAAQLVDPTPVGLLLLGAHHQGEGPVESRWIVCDLDDVG